MIEITVFWSKCFFPHSMIILIHFHMVCTGPGESRKIVEIEVVISRPEIT